MGMQRVRDQIDAGPGQLAELEAAYRRGEGRGGEGPAPATS